MTTPAPQQRATGAPLLTAAEKQRIIALRREGKSHGAIAREIGRSQGSVARTLMRNRPAPNQVAVSRISTLQYRATRVDRSPPPNPHGLSPVEAGVIKTFAKTGNAKAATLAAILHKPIELIEKALRDETV